MVLLYEFDDNVAVVATTVVSITTGIVQFRENNTCRGRWFKLGFRFAYLRSVSAAAVGVAPAPAGVFQLPSHHEPPQTTVHERCERHK